MPPAFQAFLDESGQRESGAGTDRYYVVAGVLAREGLVQQLSDEFGGLKRSFFGTPNVEIKSNWLRQPLERTRRYVKPYGVSEARITAFVSSMYDWCLATDLLFIAGVIDKLQLAQQYATPHHPSALGYQVFLQRYQKFLASRKADGSVTFDAVGGASAAGNQWQALLKRQHRKLKASGCNYTGMQFSSISDSLAFANSASTPLLQIADIAAYNTFRQFKQHGVVWDDPSAKQLPVYSYFNRLLPRFHQSPTGVFAGFGVAKMPTKARHDWLAK